MEFTFKRKVALAAVALAAVAFGGGAYAATQDSGTSDRQAFINDVAKRLGVTPQQVTNALKGAFADRLDAAVKAGKLTQAQANELKQRIEQEGAPPLGFGFGLHHDGEPGFGFKVIGEPLGGAAKYLGLTPMQLMDQLRQGKSLADIAKSKGKSVDGLKSAMMADQRARLDQAVKDKMLTAAQEQRILSKLSAGLDQLINHKGHGPIGFGFHRGFGFGHRLDKAPPPGGGGATLPAPPGPPPVPY